MKKILLLLTVLLLSGPVLAGSIREIVFFGDSLTDNGNLYKVLKVIPRSPPYYNGRFSNGPVWADTVGDHYQDQLAITYSNYAYGGATVLMHDSMDQFFIPITLEAELYNYYANSLFSEQSDKLFAIWIGANDYLLDEETDVDSLSTQVVDQIAWAIDSLLSQGAQHFLIFSLPDLAKAPFASENDRVERLHLLTELHNEKLAKAIENFKNKAPQAQFIAMDIYAIFNDLLTNTDHFNQQYNTHLTVLNQPCWQGGITAELPRSLLQNTLNADLQQNFITPNKQIMTRFNPHTLTDIILNSPDLREAYRSSGLKQTDWSPCDHPEQYAFWDRIHPTTVVHQILAAITIETIDKQAKDALIL